MSTSSDQPLPTAPKSPLSGASIPSAPAPAPTPFPAAPAPGSGLSKPSFKVTRSPFAPRISTGGPGSAATMAAAPAVRSPARKTVSASGEFTKPESSGLVVLDLIAAGVAIAAAVMMALAYFKK